MTVGLLIITHGESGQQLLNTATHMLGVCPLATEVVPAHFDCDTDDTYHKVAAAAKRLDQGRGVLVLTDMFGSTPCNIATRLRDDLKVSVVAGLNLPMLVRILNYPRLDLNELTEKAISGGRDGVLLSQPVTD